MRGTDEDRKSCTVAMSGCWALYPASDTDGRLSKLQFAKYGMVQTRYVRKSARGDKRVVLVFAGPID